MVEIDTKSSVMAREVRKILTKDVYIIVTKTFRDALVCFEADPEADWLRARPLNSSTLFTSPDQEHVWSSKRAAEKALTFVRKALTDPTPGTRAHLPATLLTSKSIEALALVQINCIAVPVTKRVRAKPPVDERNTDAAEMEPPKAKKVDRYAPKVGDNDPWNEVAQQPLRRHQRMAQAQGIASTPEQMKKRLAENRANAEQSEGPVPNNNSHNCGFRGRLAQKAIDGSHRDKLECGCELTGCICYTR